LYLAGATQWAGKPAILLQKKDCIKQMSMIEIGRNIRRIREIKNYTQEAVADMVGMSITAYGDIERGKSDVNFARLADIAKALEVREEDIVAFGSTVYNSTFNNHENAILNGVGVTNSSTNNIYSIPKEVFDKMMKDKDDEIAYLREQLKKG
jgi:transcriptional regulator with XRE-family HTH domain